jgi:glycosyltransferase involved in cell wall biosynthesis
MPYYEQSEFVLDAVRSVESQTYANVELILVDDCSPRTSAAELLAWRQMSNLKIIRHTANKGAAASRNTAVQNAKGEFILPLDADDMIASTYLQSTVPVLVADPNLGGVYTQVQRFGDFEDVWIPECVMPRHLSWGGPNTFLFRREVFDSVGGYKEHLRFAEDFDFWISAFERGWCFERIDEVLFFRRLQPAGKSNRKDWVEVMRNLLKEHRALCESNAEDLLVAEIEKYWQQVDRYRILYDQYQDLERLAETYGALYQEYGAAASGPGDNMPKLLPPPIPAPTEV